MRDSFAEISRVLRRDAWATIVFHSTDGEVWQAIESAAGDAGLSIAGATYLDKTQLSHKGYKGRSGREDVAAYDVVMALRNRPRKRKPAAQVRRSDAARILQAHLEGLPQIGIDAEADRRRTLPYLHSLLLQHHFNGDIGLHIGEYDVVRDICEQVFSSDPSGRWQVIAKGKPRVAVRAR
jgi:hypothetical protein